MMLKFNRYWTALAVAASLNSFAQVVEPQSTEHADRTVQCLDDPSTFFSINSAISASSQGDKIEVCPGIYNENVNANVVGLKLVSRILHAAKIYPGNPGAPGIQINARGVEIEGFTVAGFSFGIFSNNPGGEAKILKNLLLDNGTGLGFNNSPGNKVIKNIVVRNADFGINDFSNNIIVKSGQANYYEKNIVQFNLGFGIFINTASAALAADPSFVRAVILKNSANNNAFDGIHLNNSFGVRVLGNDMSYNGHNGLFLINSDSNLVLNNTAFKNGAYSTLNTLTGCGVQEGAGNCGGIRVNSVSEQNLFGGNKMFGNRVWDAHDSSSGSGTAGTANFWDENRCKLDSPDGLCRSFYDQYDHETVE